MFEVIYSTAQSHIQQKLTSLLGAREGDILGDLEGMSVIGDLLGAFVGSDVTGDRLGDLEGMSVTGDLLGA